MFVRRALGVAMLLMAIGTRAEASSLALSFVSENNGFTDGGVRMLGWQFTVNGSPITVSALGWQDFGGDGLAATHQVGIWLPDKTLIATATVQAGTASTLTDFFRFEPLAAPVTLSANTTYIIAGLDSLAEKQVWDVFLGGYAGYEVSGFAVDSLITIGAAGSAFGAYAPTSGGVPFFAFPDGPIGCCDTRSALLGPNFLIGGDDVAAVPEPATLLLVAAGLGLVARRLLSASKLA
jgi:hypothetical protein